MNTIYNKKMLISNCILHIGMNKAGSSAIQEYLQSNDLGSKYYFVKLGSSNHSSYITSLFSLHPENQHDYKKRNLTKEEINKINIEIKKRLIGEFEKKQAENYIISGEGILNLSPLELKNLYSFLKSFYLDITVVAYVREPWSFMESLFQQCLKGGIISDFKIEGMYPRYQNIFEKFFQIFGCSRVHLWQYQKNIVADFCQRLGIPNRHNTFNIANESLTLEAISLLYVYRKFFPFGAGQKVIEENKNFIEKLKHIGTIKFRFSDEVIEPILSKNSNDLQWIESRVGTLIRKKINTAEILIRNEEDLYNYANQTIRKLFRQTAWLDNKKIELNEIANLVEKLKMSKKELCIVHIGMPKTGSSTLQDTFYEIIEDKRVSYGNLPEPNQSGRFAGLFMNKPENYHYFSNRGWNREQIEFFNQRNRESLIQGFLNNDSSIELISGEDLFHLQKNEIEKMKLFLSNYFHKILIVAYVRPVKSFMESAFQQLVKNHYLGNFDFSRIYHKYKNFKNYDDVFGSENVLLWKFDPNSFPEGDIVLDFCSRLGLTPTHSKQKIVNESLSKEAISILFTYHYHSKSKTDFGIRTHLINNKLINKIRTIGNTKFRFSSKLIEKVIDNYKEDYTWIIQRMCEPFDDIQNSDTPDEGIFTPMELLQYSVKFIPDLLNLLENKNIESDNTPQTVAKLVDRLMIQLSHV